jgi:hypothetical protein
MSLPRSMPPVRSQLVGALVFVASSPGSIARSLAKNRPGDPGNCRGRRRNPASRSADALARPGRTACFGAGLTARLAASTFYPAMGTLRVGLAGIEPATSALSGRSAVSRSTSFCPAESHFRCSSGSDEIEGERLRDPAGRAGTQLLG